MCMDFFENKTQGRLVYNKNTLEILGEFNQWRSDNPGTPLGQNSELATVVVGQSLSPYKHDAVARSLLNLEDLHDVMLKRHKEKEKAALEAARPEAERRLDAMESELGSLMEKYKCYVSYHMAGDTHGIYEDYLYISTNVNGIYFERKIGDY